MFSIIICTYNPDELILQRLLTALERNARTAGSIQYEIIIVDNNSKIPVKGLEFVKAFSDAYNTRFVKETNPGLTSARIAGVKNAQYEWVMFFDDDNEPDDDYLVCAQRIIDQHPETGMLGPGRVKVEFTGQVDKFAESHKGDLFQERNMTETIIDNVRWDQDAYPYGTGMIVRKSILEEYMRLVENGRYTMSDRIGKSLISGGDTQILLTGIKMGYYGGSSPEIKLTHLIKPDKTTFKKILQLSFMLSASAIKSYNQVFDDAPFDVVPISNKYVLKTFYMQMRMHLFKKPFKQVAFFLTKRLGELQAHVIAADAKKSPVLLELYYKLIS